MLYKRHGKLSGKSIVTDRKAGRCEFGIKRFSKNCKLKFINAVEPHLNSVSKQTGVRSKTPPEGYSVFFSYERETLR